MLFGEVVLEQVVVDSGTHKDQPNGRVFPENVHNRQKDEICVDVPLMHLVKHQEGELQQQLAGAMDESLQEDTVRHINDFGVAVETAVHTDLVPHLALLVDLLRQDLRQVYRGESPGLHYKNFAIAL